MNKKEKGQALIVVAIVLVSLLTLLALVLDTGRVYIEHNKLKRAADSAALAAVQDLPDETRAKRFGSDAFKLNGEDELILNLQFSAPLGEDKPNMASATAQRNVNTRMSKFLGIETWPIRVQSIARKGPVASTKNWVPIGVYEDKDNPQGINLYEHYRLTNTPHTPANNSDVKKLYVPLNTGNSDYIQQMRDTIKSTARAGDIAPLLNQNSTNFDIKDICEGVDQRIKLKHPNVEGCFDVSSNEPIDYSNINIVGPGVRRDWSFGEDPRLVYIPFVVPRHGNTVEIVGFGLFYIEYAHYDPNPPGGTAPMTEIVGYFVKSVVEGPIIDSSADYGVIGIEYVDLDKLP